jgi:hypothetical protein
MDIYLDIYIAKDKFLPQPLFNPPNPYNPHTHNLPDHIRSRYYQTIYKYSVTILLSEFFIFSVSILNRIFLAVLWLEV